MPLSTGLVDRNASIEDRYVNALLTTMATTSLRASVALVPGMGVPSLTYVAGTVEEQEWVDSFHFNYEQLNATRIISLILTLAGWRFYHFLKKDYMLNALLALPDGTERNASFAIRRVSRFPTGWIWITRVA